MHIFVQIIQKIVVMKQIFTTITLLAMALSFASCEKEIIVNCNCNCQCGNSDQNGERPDNGGPDNNDGPGNDSGNNGGSGDNGGSGSGSTGTDRGEYETYNNTFTKGQAGFYGAYYEDYGQPSNVSNWYIELADNNYDFVEYEGTGYNVVLEIFANGTSSTNIPAGTYTIEAFENSEYSAGSLMYGFIAEDEEYGEYPAGTWLYEGNEGIAGATTGELKVSVSGSTYTLKYTLYDDEYGITFTGTYTGSLTIYDGTQEYSYAAALPSFAPRATKANTKYFKVRR